MSSSSNMPSPGTLYVDPSGHLTTRALAHVDDALEEAHFKVEKPDPLLTNTPPAVFGAGGPMLVDLI